MSLTYRCLLAPTALFSGAPVSPLANTVFVVTPAAGGAAVPVFATDSGGAALAAAAIKSDVNGNVSGFYVTMPGSYVLTAATGYPAFVVAVQDTRDIADGTVAAAVTANTTALTGKLDTTTANATYASKFAAYTPGTKLLLEDHPDSGAVHAAFRRVIDTHTFNGTVDTILYEGYNTDGSGGTPATAGEPIARRAIEADYNDGVKRVIEIYSEVILPSGAMAGYNIRPFFSQTDRSTGSTATSIDVGTTGGELRVLRAENQSDYLMLMNNAQTVLRRQISLIGPAPSLFLGDHTAAADVQVVLDALATQSASLVIAKGGVESWKLYQPASSTSLLLRDSANSRALLQIFPGSAINNSVVAFNCIIGVGATTTAGRPNAGNYSPGSMVWDSTLGKPIWTNGATWRLADGTAA